VVRQQSQIGKAGSITTMEDDSVLGEEATSAIRKYALQNALEYNGNGKSGSVLGRLLSEFPDLRSSAKDLIPLISEHVEEANSIAKNDGLERVREILEGTNPEALNREKQKKRVGLPELRVNGAEEVVLRFAPNPNGPLSIGHSRGVVINSEFAKMYSGKIILRFDDTDTKIKPPLPSAYKSIEDEFEWISGVKPDVVIRASSRMDVYLEHAENMISQGICYVCKCSASGFKSLRDNMLSCPCRENNVELNLDQWKMMILGEIEEGGSVVRVRTDLDLPNPALRDWPALRIQHTPHPIVGDKYKVWPLLDFQSAVEDHLQGVTHIVRGKDLMDSTRKQALLYEHMGWKYPETLYWGRVKLHEFGGFSTSSIRESIEKGDFSDWDDPRLPTVSALKRRGYTPEAIREFWIELGLTQKDISISMQTIDSKNSKIIDSRAARRAFVEGPVILNLVYPEDISHIDDVVRLNNHPDHPEMGYREWGLERRTIQISKNDYCEGVVRLKDFADVDIRGENAIFISREKGGGAQIIHWNSLDSCVKAEIIVPADDENIVLRGVIEDSEYAVGEIVQLERMGFAKVESTDQENGNIGLIWLHG